MSKPQTPQTLQEPQAPQAPFWTETFNKDGEFKGVAIDNTYLLDFMGTVGLKKYRIGDLADSVWVYKADRFWRIVNDESVKDIVIKAIKVTFWKEEHVHEVINKVNGVNNIFKRGFLTGLRLVEIQSMIDTEYTSYNYYRNGVVIVGRDGSCVLKSYDDVKGDIWESTVIDRDYPTEHNTNLITQNVYSSLVGLVGADCKGSLIEQFIRKITADEVTYNAVRASIGYLMHRYKSESLTRLVSLTDTDFDTDASGGNGKTLIAKILGQVRNVFTINHDVGGKMKEFVFANITSDVDIVFHDELPSGFKLNRLFTVVTGDLTIEKKGKDIVNIPFDVAPKHISASNHPFEGTGGSFSGRLNEVQINHYYERDRLQPKDDFGKEFFKADFGSVEWMLFDAFMIDCVSYFFGSGLVKATNETIVASKLILNTNEGFCMFLEDLDIDDTGMKFTARRMISEFIASQDVISNLNVNTMTKWLKEWCSVKGFVFSKGRESGGERRRFLEIGNGGKDVWIEFGVAF